MAKLDKDIMDIITSFFISEIGSKAMDGVTYALIINNDKNKGICKSYLDIKRKLQQSGHGINDVFRVFEVANGYVFDLDMSIAKRILHELSKALRNTDPTIKNIDYIGNYPENRRKSDLNGLAKYIKYKYDNKVNTVEVALYNRNPSTKIWISGIGQRNEMIAVEYNAYAVRHYDIKTLNEMFLIPAGIRVSRVEPCEILPSSNGVSFRLYIESI